MIPTGTLKVITTWLAFATLFVAVIAIPAGCRATVCVDDFVWITNAWSSASLPQALSIAWSNNFFYRPIDILANRLISPSTLDLWPIQPVQVAGLLAATAGMWRLLVLVDVPGLGPRLVATGWLWLHPATQLSIWSAGCSSQTWSAAFGIWIMCDVLALPQRQVGWAKVVKLALLSAAGVVAKELFLGWATAGACVVASRHVFSKTWERPLRTSKTTISVVGAIVLPPCIWIALRLWSTRFGEVVHAESNGLYTLHGPVTIGANLLISVLGMFVQGPVHWARLLGLPWMLVPFVAAGLSFFFATLGGPKLGGVSASIPARFRLPLAVAIGVLAIWPALLIGKVSELYLMGPNALIAVLIGIGASGKSQRSRVGQSIAAMALLLIAVVGYASRSYHFSVTWSQARELRQSVDQLANDALGEDRLVIVVPESLRAGPMHSKYLVPAAVAASLDESWRVKRLADPSLPRVEFLAEGRGDLSAGNVTVLAVPSTCRIIW